MYRKSSLTLGTVIFVHFMVCGDKWTNRLQNFRLYIKQPPSTTSYSDDDCEPEWFEYKIKETNMFTVDKYQQVSFTKTEN